MEGAHDVKFDESGAVAEERKGRRHKHPVVTETLPPSDSKKEIQPEKKEKGESQRGGGSYERGTSQGQRPRGKVKGGTQERIGATHMMVGRRNGRKKVIL